MRLSEVVLEHPGGEASTLQLADLKTFVETIDLETGTETRIIRTAAAT